MNYSNVYNIDFRALAAKLSPPKLRKLKLIDWLFVLLKPLEEINFLFKSFRKQAIYKVTHNGQVVYLEKVLNDQYDNELRRIYIEDAFAQEPVYIYPENENLPIYIPAINTVQEIANPVEITPIYIYDDFEFLEGIYDFIVFVPEDLRPSTAFVENTFIIKMRSLVNYYKLASRRFKIQWI